MYMSSTLLPPSDDANDNNDHQNLKPKKEKVIQPINDNVTQQDAPKIPGANEDLLAELRARTAELAEGVRGNELPKSRILNLDDAKNPDQIIAELEREQKVLTQRGNNKEAASPAVELVRAKLAKMYKKEPDASEEALDSYRAGNSRSKHQQFMYDLTTSGKSLADIQTEWHNYYIELTDNEKHKVWKEFYEAQHHSSKPNKHQNTGTEETPKTTQKKSRKTPKRTPLDPRSVKEIKSQMLDKVSAGGKLSAVQHAKSLLFGLSLAGLVGLIITFTFFNEVFIAPFISPSKSVSATPIIGNQSTEVGPEPKIIIPKINLEVPVVFGLGTIEEDDIQDALEDGVVHYSSTPNPGETGNSVIVGHSSNNILNSGKYKFAFVLLKRLETEDTFFVQKGGVRYTYKVYKKEVVGPNDVSVLNTQDKPNTMTLITCDPPGTSINRLIITAEQISPDPSKNTASTAPTLTSEEATLPSNAPSLWSRLTGWIF